MMWKRIVIGMMFVLTTTLFCFFYDDYDVSATDRRLYLTVDYADSYDYDVDSVQEWSGNQQNKHNNNGVEIPSTVISDGVCVAFGASDVGTYNTYYSNQTYYIESPTSYTAQTITYNNSSYQIKYPCVFINYYPENVQIPAGYTTVGGNYNRTIIYPDTSNGALGIIFTAFICPANTGKKLLVVTDYNNHSVVNPLTTNGITYNDWYWQNGYSQGIMIAHPPRNQYDDYGVNSYWIMDNIPVPVFCDLYDALEYSCSGRILYPEHVLAGADSAVVTPTSTPTATPTATPSPTQIPYPTSMEISGGQISVDNFPSPTPTPPAWFPVIDDPSSNERPTDIPEDVDYEYVLNLYRQSQEYLGLPTDTPSPDELSEFWSSYNQYLWNSEDGFIPKNIISDFSNPDDEESEDYPGSIFRYPRTAMENVEDSGFLKLVADTVSIFGDGSDDYVVQPGDNIMTYIMFGVVGIFVFWIFSKIMR